MRTGSKISAIGHGALIALALFGVPWFGPREREPIRVTEVSFITEAEFAAAQAAASPDAPREATAPALPPPARPAPAPAPEPPTEIVEAPEPPDQQVAILQPPAPAESAVPPEIAPPVATPAPPTAAAPPRARPAPRVEPNPTPPPDETLRPAEVPEPVPTPDPVPEPEPERVEETPAAPPEAAPEVAEAMPPAPLALVSSGRPRPREVEAAPRETPPPDQAAAVMAAVQQEAARRPETPPTPATPATEPTRTEPTAAATSLPVGPPLTNSEKDGLKLAVQRCWNVPAGLRDAQELKVTLAAELGPDGQVINASIRLLEPSPAPDGRFQQAYEAGRRALIRCAPYDGLPRDKFGQWRNIEVVFNPEGMVSW
jgi:hypothetical protein